MFDAEGVADLGVVGTTQSSVTLSWTEIDDGTGQPARYRLKYAEPPFDWSEAEVGCDRSMAGTEIGATRSCTVEGLAPDTEYEFQLMSYRLVNGVWRDAAYSNVANASTAASATGGSPNGVSDLTVTSATATTLTVQWTEVDDGTGQPARYRLKYAEPSINWSSAAVGCARTMYGTAIGATMSCTVEGLTADTDYELQLMSYRLVDGAWQDALYSNVASGTTSSTSTGSTGGGTAAAVADLTVTSATQSTLTVRWTEVDDGAGQPASYRLKYAAPSIDWSNATVGCDATMTGTAIGATMSCTVDGLGSGTDYELQLVSYRLADGAWQDAHYSNVAQGRTMTGAAQAAPSGIWIGPSEIAALPTSGPAWENVLNEATGSCGRVDLADQEQSNNVCIMAKALVFARLGNESYRADVVDAIEQIVGAPTYDGRALALGRELGAYVIAADLIGLPTHDAALDRDFRQELRSLLATYTYGGPGDLVECHERRPNNWGTMCGGSRAAIAVYLGDTQELERTAQVFKGWLGDRSAYAGFSYGDLSWQCDRDRPVGINPAGCARDGHDLSGVLPDDQRRGGSYTWPPPRENYVWEALQGALMQAVILERAGYPAFDWEDRALLRAAQWLHTELGYAAEGDDTWQPHILNHYYGTSFPAPTPTRAGKNVGWTDWTLG